MQTVLETVLFELHKSKEDNLAASEEIKRQLKEISVKQQESTELFTKMTKELSTEISQHITKVNRKSPSAEETVAACIKSFSEVQSGISNLQKNIGNKFNSLNSSLQVVETSCTTLQQNTETNNVAHRGQYEDIQAITQKIYGSIKDVKDENRRAREHLLEIEKSISALSEPGVFQVAGPKLMTDSLVQTSTHSEQPVAQLSDPEIEESDDDEITFLKTVITTDSRSSSQTVGVEDINIDLSSNQESQTSNTSTQDNTCISEKEQPKPLNDDRKTESKPFTNRKPLVCLVGDALVGQLNVPLLGKSSNTFNRRLKAPKIQDVEKYKAELKDSKLIIIHTGINNIRNKEDTDACTNLLVSAVTSLKEGAPNAKIVISRLLPVGDRQLDIERTLLNATNEKKLLDIHTDIIFLDHSNLSHQGNVIEEYFREDKLHLSNCTAYLFLEAIYRER